MKICVYAISKNESQFVDRFCDSAKDADFIMIADTGSTDDTVSKAISNGAFVSEICITPWRFDKARDAAMALIPKDIDVCISLDLDEVLEPGWRKEIERVWKAETTRLRYKFDWGNNITFYYEKFMLVMGIIGIILAMNILELIRELKKFMHIQICFW
jgi:glycosyltransferase involved in cell wall biosynthesis